MAEKEKPVADNETGKIKVKAKKQPKKMETKSDANTVKVKMTEPAEVLDDNITKVNLDKPINQEKNEQPKEVKENESNGETTKTANASKKNNTKQKNIQSKENKTVSHTDILTKIDENIKDVGKNLQLKNLVTLKAMSDTEILLSAYNVPFYKPKDIYVDQLNISDGREIYNNINLNSYIQQDPIATKINKINELKIERQQLLIQLEVLNNG